jgi:glutamate--cysteine ligase
MTSNEYAFEGGFGLERETLRVDFDGRLSQTAHPFTDTHLERDFCENQLEIITPVCDSADSVLEELGRLSQYAENILAANGEYLWLCSNPPHIENEDEIPVAQFDGENLPKTEYRLNLQKRYGKRLMLYSGIHFNFSFSEKFLRTLCPESEDFAEFKNKTYLKLFKYASRYSWLIVLLTAASPLYDASLDGDGLCGTAFDGYSSRRSGDKGYWNSFVPTLDYSSLESYAESAQRYIQSGALFSAGELYLPVRLKPHGKNNLDSLAKNGADHIELRMFDLNPLAPHGVFAEDLKFAHFLLLYLLSLPDFEYSPALQIQAIANHKAAAKFELDGIEINGQRADTAALGLIEDMKIFFSDCDKFDEVCEVLDYQKRKLVGKNRYSDEVYRLTKDDFHGLSLERFIERSKTICANCLEQV